jgi:uncharacterized protein (TIGR03545 family)
MRWKGIYLLIVLAVFFGIIGIFFLDNIIDWSMERSLETVTGAKAEIDKVHLSFRDWSIGIAHLQVANPRDTWRNLVETTGLRLQIEPGPLFSGKIIIRQIKIADLKLNSARKTDGTLKRALLPGPFGEAQARLHQDIAAAPFLNTEGLKREFNPDQLFASYKFQTNFSAAKIRSDLDASRQKWDANLDKLDQVKQKIAELNRKITEIGASKVQTVIDLQNKIRQIKEIQNSVEEVGSQVGDTGKNLQTDFQGLATMIHDLKKVAEGDFRALLKLAKLPDFESVDMANLLFGEALLNESAVFVDLMDKIQAYFPPDPTAAPKESHPRGGEDISFPGRKTYPRLLIEEISIAGRGNPGTKLSGYSASGQVKGITNEPLIYGLPLVVSLNGMAANHAYLDLDGAISQSSHNFAGQFQLKLGRLPVPEYQLSGDRFLPGKIATGNAEILTRLKVKPGYFKLNMEVSGNNISGDYSGNPPATDLGTEIIREVLSKIDHLLIRYELEGANRKLKMKVASNLDEVIVARFQSVIGAKIAQFTQAIRARVDAELHMKQAELENLRSKYYTEYNAKISELQAAVAKQKAEIEARRQELENQLQAKRKETEGQLKSKQNELETEIKSKTRLQLPSIPNLSR